jgi:hypothetical protein
VGHCANQQRAADIPLARLHRQRLYFSDRLLNFKVFGFRLMVFGASGSKSRRALS